MGTIRNYPTPEGTVLQKDFQIRVRAAGQVEWQEVSCYQVKVDMHEVRCASMAYFDFSQEAEVEITCPALFFIYQVELDFREDFELYDERFLGYDHPESRIDLYIPVK